METGGGGGVDYGGGSSAIGGGGAGGGVDADCCGSSNVLATADSEFPMAAVAVAQISVANTTRTTDLGVLE